MALLIRLSTGGKILFRQTRCGLNGRSFTLYKFRTMVEDAEERRGELLHLNEMNGPVFKLRSDPRVTRVGRFLRKFSLDELPQLWNVLRGDMSLVGPRPPIPEEVAQYQRWQRRRLAMKPGLTCLWQVTGRNQIDFDHWMRARPRVHRQLVAVARPQDPAQDDSRGAHRPRGVVAAGPVSIPPRPVAAAQPWDGQLPPLLRTHRHHPDLQLAGPTAGLLCSLAAGRTAHFSGTSASCCKTAYTSPSRETKRW